MGWIKLSGKILEYSGKLAQADGFEEWAENEAKSLIEELALKRGFSLFGKKRAIKNEIWEELKIATSSEALKNAINSEVQDYIPLLDTIAKTSSGLVKANCYPDIIVIPRYLLNINAYLKFKSNLFNSDELSKLKGGEFVREFFIKQLVIECDKALVSRKVDPKNNLKISDNCYLLNFDKDYEWYETWSGHYFVCKKILGKLEKDESTKLIEEIKILSAKLGRLTREGKNRIKEGIKS